MITSSCIKIFQLHFQVDTRFYIRTFRFSSSSFSSERAKRFIVAIFFLFVARLNKSSKSKSRLIIQLLERAPFYVARFCFTIGLKVTPSFPEHVLKSYNFR